MTTTLPIALVDAFIAAASEFGGVAPTELDRDAFAAALDRRDFGALTALCVAANEAAWDRDPTGPMPVGLKVEALYGLQINYGGGRSYARITVGRSVKPDAPVEVEVGAYDGADYDAENVQRRLRAAQAFIGDEVRVSGVWRDATGRILPPPSP